MLNEQVLIVAAALTLIYATFSRLAAKSILTPAMAFMAVGLLFGPLGLGVITIELDNEGVALLATVALAIILCSDASQVDWRKVRQIERLPIRLLLIGLPLTMLLGAGIAAVAFHDFALAAVALLAVVLAPTDAALGQAVISSETVPEPVREALNVESGLNDGIAMTPIFVLIFVLGGDLAEEGSHGWLTFAALQLLLGPAAGALVGMGGGRLIDIAAERGWLDTSFGRLTLPAIALLAYALAEAIGGNGLIAAFVSGFVLAVKDRTVREQMTEFGETEGTLLSLLVFLLLGLIVLPAVVPYWNATTTVYALLSLTVVRMLPVAISLLGLGLDAKTVLFLGWFGPRGIASVLYLLVLIDYLGVSGYEELIATGVQTIALSVLLHGATAAPLAERYGRAMSARDVA